MPEVVHWNPVAWRRASQRGLGRLIPIRKGVRNFGDLLGPLIVARLRQQLSLGRESDPNSRLLAVGSIMRLAAPGDVVWGAGINGKTMQGVTFPVLDVRAVRGPLTAQTLRAHGNTVPDTYGDPALLIPRLWTEEELGVSRRSQGVVLMPNYNDIRDWPENALSPLGNPLKKIRALASADVVIASSLHAIIIAEAFGVPTILVRSSKETLFKYEDYYLGTGRELPQVAPNWRAALDWTPTPPLTNWDPRPLIASFPSDLWQSSARGRQAQTDSE